MSTITVRGAAPADFPGIAKVAVATGQDEEWAGSDPAYLAFLLEHGTLLVAERDGAVTGFGATRLIGEGPSAISMLCDLFIHPGTHGRGCGRAILSQLWPGEPGRDRPRRMTFSSLHAHALPLYTRFGLDAWWPLLYLAGDVGAVRVPDGWTVARAPAVEVGVAEVAAAEQGWTGVDRSADHRAWAARPHGQPVRAFRHGELAAAGTTAGQRVRPGSPGDRAGSPGGGRGAGRAGHPAGPGRPGPRLPARAAPRGAPAVRGRLAP